MQINRFKSHNTYIFMNDEQTFNNHLFDIQMLPIEIWQLVLSKVEFLDQIRLRLVSTLFYQNLEIYDFYNIDNKYLERLDDDVLATYPFIMQLNAALSPKINNIKHMTKLQKLNAGKISGIDDDSINHLNLTELYVSNNPKITNIKHMTKLQILCAENNYGIGDDSISNFNLTELCASDNPKITNIKHMTKLQILCA